MATYFHVSTTDLVAGTVLQPGNWGDRTRHFIDGRSPGTVKDALILTWEATLEATRLLANTAAPSRLNCVFACGQMEDAVTFRDGYRQGAAIYEIEAPDGTPVHVGDFSLISVGRPGTMIDVWVVGSASYWRDPPAGLKEVLIGGPVTVIKKCGADGKAEDRR
ncbi:hypothetical protein [Bradyrhizobium canariense]|uniref:Uncharacterized protein n=1 Tax=Bradyrhizobium canariense TaxID=255045 RepID=A0A1H1Q6F9_9BRAD|nr:hypothetical protein [Bradyrhizobium canariense]SDS19082.1 hypothetical protein SAMN05444158_1290 [Bradyrhizobium canariense]